MAGRTKGIDMEHAVNPDNGRKVCTPENPAPKGAPGRWEHTNAHEISDGDYTATYECKDCGHVWTEELPQ
jgi:hypothetical protein